jgi:hypothetical protein
MPGVIYPNSVQDELGNIDAVQADLRPVYLITTLPFLTSRRLISNR